MERHTYTYKYWPLGITECGEVEVIQITYVICQTYVVEPSHERLYSYCFKIFYLEVHYYTAALCWF